jgi:hypothetical protein
VPEVVKMKRPLSVWFAQIILILLIIFFVWMYSRVLDEQSPDFIGVILDDPIRLARRLFGIVIGVACLTALVGLGIRAKVGRFLAIGVFLLISVLLTYGIATEFFVPDDFHEDQLVETMGKVIGILILLLPPSITALALIFSPKVKMFFDPSLIPQIDETSAIFKEPPPPPRFDE